MNENESKTLITRGYDDALPLAEILVKLGAYPIIDSLLKVNYCKNVNLELDRVQALLMTSANGVRAFSKISKARNLLVYAVGDATAYEAKKNGFVFVKSASGNVKDLAKVVIQTLDPKGGKVCHITGSRVAGELGQIIVASGFEYFRAVLYKTEESQRFLNSTLQAFKYNDISSVLLYSPRTAITFRKLVFLAGIKTRLEDVKIFCLSDAVAKEVLVFPKRNLIVSKTPDQDSLLSKFNQQR